MKAWILGSLILAHPSKGGDLSCAHALQNLDEFPIEKNYPHQKVRVGSSEGILNRGSRAFILWRQRTPLHIPDLAFNFHYYRDPKEFAEAAGFFVGDEREGSSVDLQEILNAPHLSAANRDRLKKFYETNGIFSAQHKDPGAIDALARHLRKRGYSSAQYFLRASKISLELTPEKLRQINENIYQREIHPFAILADGRVILVLESERRKFTQLTDRGFQHIYILELWKQLHGLSEIQVIDLGTIRQGNTPSGAPFYLHSYREQRMNTPIESREWTPADSMNYIQNYFGAPP